MLRRVFLALMLALLALASPVVAFAQSWPIGAVMQMPPPGLPPGPPPPRRAMAPGYSIQPLDRILPTIRSAQPGRFYDAEGPFPDPAGGWHYRVKWMTPQGRIVWLDADARTGHVIGPYRGYARMALPPAGLRYYPYPGSRGPGRFGRWGPGGGRGGWGGGGGHRH